MEKLMTQLEEKDLIIFQKNNEIRQLIKQNQYFIQRNKELEEKDQIVGQELEKIIKNLDMKFTMPVKIPNFHALALMKRAIKSAYQKF